MMNKKIYYFIILIYIFFFQLICGCIDNTSNENTNNIGILVSIIPQYEMVKSIGGKYVDVTVMIPAGESPHTYETTPEQMIKVAKAVLYFKIGSGVEFELLNMDSIIEQNPDLKIYDCSENIEIISFDQHYGMEDYQNENEDHDHEGTDPHIWTSPLNYKKMAKVVYNGLIDIDQEHKEEYLMNYGGYISVLEDFHENLSSMLQQYEGRSFMVYHPAWGYFSDTYKLRMISIEDEGKKPGPAGVAAIIEQAKNENISVVFVTPQYDISSSETIAEEIGGEVIYANPLMTDYMSTLYQLVLDMISGFEK